VWGYGGLLWSKHACGQWGRAPNVINLTGHRVIIGKRTTNGGIGLSAEGGVISFDNNRSVVVKQNKGITS